jgi:hypothetical protein
MTSLTVTRTSLWFPVETFSGGLTQVVSVEAHRDCGLHPHKLTGPCKPRSGFPSQRGTSA